MRVTARRGDAADAPALARLRWRWRVEERGSSAGEVSGMAWLMLATRVPSPRLLDRRTGDVQSVYVVPERRDLGVGTALLDAVLREAREMRLHHVTVHSGDRAVPFYLRSGFAGDDNWLHWEPPT